MVRKKFNDHPFPYHAEIELEISTLTNHGVGLGRAVLSGSQLSALSSQPTQPQSGWVVMIPFTLPGERVRARVFRNHANYSEADLIAVLSPSPKRIAPTCPLFGRCGGCQYQHLDYSEQLLWKQRQVRELLQHMAGLEFVVSPVVPSPRTFGYRSKITPHFQVGKDGAPGPSLPKDATAGGRRQTPIGFLKQGSRFDIVDVPHCPIATDAINEKLPAVRERARERMATGEYQRGATLLLREASEGVTTDYDAVITEEIPLDAGTPLRLRFLARDFFQNNPFILPAFVRHVRDEAAATGAQHLVDAYCGSGLFALACASRFAGVAGVEISESSIRFARENAAANGIGNATFIAGDASAIFSGLTFSPADTAVIIDPPRRGCDESFLQQLFNFGPRGVVYVSCDPATQMRDLKSFLAAGYAVTRVQPFDLFPQTRHLECVITLRRV
ncbi:MAG TPA: class I SAM-dependent RNA methyltransferase [Candidatus Didemnitutus sp.]|nr:class I SAM-dependent RNA methyltransferase [Candidatus Didemnitutus sp.]